MSVELDRPLLEPLERRRLLSLTLAGPPVDVPRGAPLESTALETPVDVAVAANGNFIVASTITYAEPHFENAVDLRVELVRYAADGTRLGDPIVIPNVVYRSPPSVSMDADGDAVVVYWAEEPDAPPGEFDVYFRLISKEGVVGPAVRLDAIRGTPTVSMDVEGGFFVGSAGDVVPGVQSQVTVQAFDANGMQRGPAFIAFHAGPVRSDLELAAFADGSGAAFAYVQGAPGDLTVGRVTTAGRVGTTRYVGGVVPNVRIERPSIAAHADGSFAVAYHRQVGALLSRPEASYAQRFDASGNPLGGEIELAAGLPGGPGLEKRTANVCIDGLSDGGFVAAFVQKVGGLEDRTLYARRFDAAGVPDPSGAVVVSFELETPAIAADDEGRVVMAWDPDDTSNSRIRQLATRASFNDEGEVYVNGTDGNDHIIVERVRERVYVNVNGVVERFSTADVQFLSITGFGGDDVIINASAIPSTIHGGDGHDTLWGGTGPDRLRGFGGDDFLHGGDGDDNLFGDTGDDTLLGEEGTDTVSGGTGNDRAFGEAGDSAVLSSIALQGTILTFTGLEATDEVTVSADGATITITPFLEPPHRVPRNLVTAILLRGHGGDDVFNVNPSIRIPVTIEGGSGNDTLAGGTGEDLLLGGDGNDLLVGNRGGDRIIGGEGEDSLRGDAGNDLIYGEAADDTLDGGDGDDYLEAGAGHDVLTGGAGRDALFGLAGSDQLFADDGVADTVRGGPGDDSAQRDLLDDMLAVEV